MLKIPLKNHSWHFLLNSQYLPGYVLFFLFAFFEVVQENKAFVYLFYTLPVAVYCEFGFFGVSGFDIHGFKN
jgi:hypothetical protein